jgi:hypothetical protein
MTAWYIVGIAQGWAAGVATVALLDVFWFDRDKGE